MSVCVCVCVYVKDTVSLNRLIAAAGTSHALPSPTVLSHCYAHRPPLCPLYYSQPFQPTITLFPHFPQFSRRWGGREVEDGGERGPLKRLTFLQDNINQSSTHTRSLSSWLFFFSYTWSYGGINIQMGSEIKP